MAKQYPEELKLAAIEAVKAGGALTRVAADHDVTTMRLRAWIAEAGVAPAHKSTRSAVPPEVREAALLDVVQGMSIRSAAKKHGVSYTTVFRWNLYRQSQEGVQ